MIYLYMCIMYVVRYLYNNKMIYLNMCKIYVVRFL